MLSRQIMFVSALAVPAVVFAQASAPTLEVTDPMAISALRSLNGSIETLSKQVMVCVEKKLAAPESCFCKYPAELAQVRREYRAVTHKYPSWSTPAVTWQDRLAGSPVGSTMFLANIGPQLSGCPGK